MLKIGTAEPRDVESLQNWVRGTGCIAREETEYLRHHRELIRLAPNCDSTISWFETWVEESLVRFCGCFRKVGS